MNKYMKIAISEARRGIKAGHGGPFGAVIVKDGEIIGRGHNMVIKNQDPTCHGEVSAIRKACKKLGTFDLSGCEIYTTGEPCPMCLAAIMWANIGNVFYGCNISDTEAIGFRDSAFYEYQKNADKSDFLKEIERNECKKLYEEYKNTKEKTYY